MIIRSSSRHLSHDAARSLQPAFDQLRLPWLCPAFLGNRRPNRRPRYTRTTATVANRRALTAPISPLHSPSQVATTDKQQGRGFAYAATPEHRPQDDYIPFENSFDNSGQPFLSQSLGGPRSPWDQKASLATLPIFEPSLPLIVSPLAKETERRFRANETGIAGTLDDIHQTLQACLQVGRIERAATCVRTLHSIYKPDAPGLIHAHHEYLGMLIAKIIQTKDQEMLKHIQRWFEVEIRSKGVEPNATTIALMLKASFQESQQKKIGRTMRRYIALATEGGIWDETLQVCQGVLNDQEIGAATRLAPHIFPPVPLDYSNPDNNEHIEQASLAPSQSHPLPEDLTTSVRAKEQKGLGLQTLKKSLAIFTDLTSVPYPYDMPGTEEERQRVYATERQRRLEEDTLSSALDRWRLEYTETIKRVGVNPCLKSIAAMMYTWHEPLVELIKEEIELANSTEINKEGEGRRLHTTAELDRAMYGPFLQYLKPEKLSAVAIISVITMMSNFGAAKGGQMTTILTKVGKNVEDESAAESLRMWDKQWVGKGKPMTDFKKRMAILRKEIPTQDRITETPEAKLRIKPREWSSAIIVRIGAVLVSMLIKVAKMEVIRTDEKTGEDIKEMQPVFWHTVDFAAGRRTGMLRMNVAMIDRLKAEPVGSTIAKQLPMLVEPVPWTNFKKGGFLLQRTAVVRIGNQHQQPKEYIKAAADSGDMKRVFAALDVLGRTPWKINRGVFDVLLKVWNTGEALANIPAENPHFEFPPEPNPNDDVTAHRKYAYELKKIENEREGMHSERCYQNFQLEVARGYLDEIFYFPHNIDFRGRAYPIPPYLNHIGADHCRGLLLFGKGKELGANGLSWLQVHLANVFGYDKASFVERRDFAKGKLAEIYDSANNPLDGKRWWLKAEDPWQCLATCMELRNAMDLPDPTKYVSHMPVHQDGTCNGLQHYAALGGDALGAKQVNLEPGERPSDIYTAVAELVQEDIASEAEKGSPIAKLLEGKITRKIVKPTVMTNVYGVTFTGAKRQVLSQLDDVYPELFKGTTLRAHQAAIYTAHKIFAALGKMFNGAQDIQLWLGECARKICEAVTPDQIQYLEDRASGKIEVPTYKRVPANTNSNKDEHARFRTGVIWTTPLKMPVVQPYRSPGIRVIETSLSNITLLMSSAFDSIAKKKQLQAFPPNFIHSLDATHMLLSALKCDEMGLSFAAVHDSFWTHAADVDVMSDVLRDSFIKMHSEDIIGRLAVEFSVRYKDCMQFASVKASSALGKRIRLSRATAQKKPLEKQAKINELLREARRMRLLQSEDPKERAEGKAMVTPATMFAEASDLDKQHIESERFKSVADELLAAEQGEWKKDNQIVDEHGGEEESDDEVSAADGSPKLTQDAVKKLKVNIRARANRKIWLWLPLQFPPVPEKGDFDVSRLKDSKYFFS